ncbi:MAG: tetratricopeptide repeat protein [Labilithrix sp.]|nr:tetratricopeptide repeat protein [Labilithrix sp.]
MSKFPRRLVDEAGDGPVRRLLESARADEPPAQLVASAILTASKSAHAAPPASGSLRVAGGRSKLVLGAGTLLVGGVLAWLGARDSFSSSRVELAATPAVAPDRGAKDDETRQGAVGAPAAAEGAAATTSVADLPNAPAVVAPSSGKADVAPHAKAAPASERPAEQTADLLREANRLRGQGRWAEAAATYRKVIDLAPDSAEAYPADVALGNLELQEGRAQAALVRYEHALEAHPGGALAEEARWGKARALRAEGRTAEEKAALVEFRARHPESPLAAAAAQRLAELGER